MSSATEAPSCGAIEGNPDFYGIGIRVGVYLQWVSACANLLVDPQSATSFYDVSSAFTFAILVATMTATFASPPTIQPIETYIMLQFALGYFVFSLNISGKWWQLPVRTAKRLREWQASRTLPLLVDLFMPSILLVVVLSDLILQLSLQPAFVEEAAEQLASAEPASFVDWLILLATAVTLPLNLILRFNTHGFSWSGPMWRTTIACMIVAVNLWLWFASQPNYRPPGESCDPPFIFMFSKQQLNGPIVTFCKAVSVFFAAIIYIPFATLLELVSTFVTRIELAFFRLVLQFVPSNAFTKLLEGNGTPFSLTYHLGATPVPTTFIDVSIEVLARSNYKDFRFSDVFRLWVYLASGKIQQQAENRSIPPQSTPERRISFLWNAVTILSIAWFILSIEFMLVWNNIEGINSISTTGQLIPFIIGCVSMIPFTRRLAVIVLAKKYNDRADITLEISNSIVNVETVETVEIRNARNTPSNDDLGGSCSNITSVT